MGSEFPGMSLDFLESGHPTAVPKCSPQVCTLAQRHRCKSFPRNSLQHPTIPLGAVAKSALPCHGSRSLRTCSPTRETRGGRRSRAPGGGSIPLPGRGMHVRPRWAAQILTEIPTCFPRRSCSSQAVGVPSSATDSFFLALEP